MSRYKGLFTFDEDTHKYVSIAQADGIIDTMDYEPDSKPAEPLIKDEKIRRAVRAFAEVIGVSELVYCGTNGEFYMGASSLQIHQIDIPSDTYTIAELCGEEEE